MISRRDTGIRTCGPIVALVAAFVDAIAGIGRSWHPVPTMAFAPVAARYSNSFGPKTENGHITRRYREGST